MIILNNKYSNKMWSNIC